MDHARDLLRRGFSVIPVLPGGKLPAVPWREFQSRHATDTEINAWFGDGAMNIGVVTGSISNLVVVDADTDAAVNWCTRHLTYTPLQVRTARGWHLYYRHPGTRVANSSKLDTRDGKLGIDVRGDGGFVVAPPSWHPSAVQYERAGEWAASVAEVPRIWPGWLQRAAPRPAPLSRSTPRPVGDVVDRARKYLAAIPVPEIGAGSDVAVLTAAGHILRGFALDDDTATTLLWAWCGNRPGWSFDWVAAKVRNVKRYGRQPVGALL